MELTKGPCGVQSESRLLSVNPDSATFQLCGLKHREMTTLDLSALSKDEMLTEFPSEDCGR